MIACQRAKKNPTFVKDEMRQDHGQTFNKGEPISLHSTAALAVCGRKGRRDIIHSKIDIHTTRECNHA